jgi:predicted RNase H-like nuclease (RuvC/YqgF family)
MFSDLREEQQDIIRDLTNKNIELKDEIYKLKEEKEQLQKRFNDYQDKKIEENANLIKRLDIADKKLTVFSRELEQANKENEKLKQYLLNIAMIIEELEQQYDDIKDFTEIKEIREILREVNQ